MQKHAREELSEQVFEKTTERLGLTAREVDKVKDLLKHETLTEPQIILQSVSVYERCVNKEIQQLLKRGITTDQKISENDLLYALRKKAGFHHLALEHPLVSTRNIAVGQAGALYGRNLKKPLIQRVVVIDNNEFSFSLQYDVDKEDIVHIAFGDEIKFAFSRQSDSVYGASLSVIHADGSGIVEVSHSLNLKRNQLRQYVRIEVTLPLKLRLIHTADFEKSDIRRGELIEAKLSDISGGGLSFLGEKSFRVGDLVTVSFDLPNMKFVGISGKILRISLQEGKLKTLIKHHVLFLDIEPRRRDMIVKYVFDKQRQLSQWR
jgi:c-di-GMP-binding flagellar brake protein YcgR